MQPFVVPVNTKFDIFFKTTTNESQLECQKKWILGGMIPELTLVSKIEKTFEETERSYIRYRFVFKELPKKQNYQLRFFYADPSLPLDTWKIWKLDITIVAATVNKTTSCNSLFAPAGDTLTEYWTRPFRKNKSYLN